MYLNFKKINNAKPDAPMLRLQTLSGKELGPVPFVHGLNFEINYSDLSTIEFSVPYMVNGMLNPLYDALTGYKVIYTDELGVYMITNPGKSGDGMSEIKQVKGYSLEYSFQKKNLYLEEGTYCFWNPVFPDETVLGRIVELDQNWSVGYVAPRLLNCYRTFDEYDNSALSFCYGEAMEQYRCAIVFDVYNKTINAYDAGDDTGSLPIYLDYENLVKEIEVTEDDENMATKLHVYGGDSLTIRNVNPIGGDYLVDLSFFLNNGDLDVMASDGTEMLSDKVRRWRADVLAQQAHYMGLVSLRSSVTANKLVLEAQLTELNGELQTLTAQQSVYIKEYALEKTDDGRANKQAQLDEIYDQIEAKGAEIAAKEAEIESAQSEGDEYLLKIKSISEALSISGYFTEGEQLILAPYLIEGELTEETFVATDVSSSNTAVSNTLTGDITFSDGEVTQIIFEEFGGIMFTLANGVLSIPNADLSAQVIRGTLNARDGVFILTAYLGTIQYSGHAFSKGMITMTGPISEWLFANLKEVTENGITQTKGTKISLRTSEAELYFTVASNEYQQYAVELELYEFGADALSDYAWPTYEFDVDTANFLYHEKFEPFKNSMELGKSVHLKLGSEGVIHPKIIGVQLDYDDITNFSLIFSNRYQRKDELEYLSDEVQSAAKASTKFDASKYLYDRTADKMTDVDAYMNNMLDTAAQTIKAAANQSVMIGGDGIHVSSSDDNIKLRIVNGMIAMTNDNWKTAKLAIGRFYSKEHGIDVWGVNAELIAGTLLLGSNLYIQTQDGSFAVDDSGVYIDALKFYINNGKNLSETLDDIDSGIEAVSYSVSSLQDDFDSVTEKTDNGITLNATDLSGMISATQAQMQNAGGNVLFDSDGIWLMNAGTKESATEAVWMNEKGILFGSGAQSDDPASEWDWTTAISHSGVVAESIAVGTLSGMTISGGEITIGKSSDSDTTYFHVNKYGNLGIGYNSSAARNYNFYVDYNGNLYSGYSSSSGDYNFKVTKSGDITANSINVVNGTFSGTLNGATGSINNITSTNGTFNNITAVSGSFSGTLSATKINGDMTSDGSGALIGPEIYVPSRDNWNFKVDSSGNVYINSGSISWGAVTGTSELTSAIKDAKDTASDASTAADNAADMAKAIANGTYNGGTFISGTEIYSPTIYANSFIVRSNLDSNKENMGGYILRSKSGSDALRIYYYQADIAPYVHFGSPWDAYACWDFSRTEFTGNCIFGNASSTTGKTVSFASGTTVDFSGANVKNLNLTVTATFG